MAKEILHFPFEAEKTEEASAYLLRGVGGSTTKLFMIKYLYLADRASLAKHGVPICGGHYYSLPHGPVVSEALDLMNGRNWTPSGGYVRIDGDRLTLVKAAERENLSDDDAEILDGILAKFGKWDLDELLAYVHELKEYKDPAGSSLPILTSDILKAQEVPESRIRRIADVAGEIQHYRGILGS